MYIIIIIIIIRNSQRYQLHTSTHVLMPTLLYLFSVDIFCITAVDEQEKSGRFLWQRWRD